MEEGNYYYLKITSNQEYTKNLKCFCAVLTELLTKIDKPNCQNGILDILQFCNNKNNCP